MSDLKLFPGALLRSTSNHKLYVFLREADIPGYIGISYLVTEYGDSFSFEVDSQCLEPIPLTPDLLEKMEFKEVPTGFSFEWHPEAWAEIRREEPDYLPARIEIMETEDGWTYQSCLGSRFHYLHDLQRLVLALTGEDLDVSSLT